jgi:uncharacterized membrane protein
MYSATAIVKSYQNIIGIIIIGVFVLVIGKMVLSTFLTPYCGGNYQMANTVVCMVILVAFLAVASGQVGFTKKYTRKATVQMTAPFKEVTRALSNTRY